MKVLMGTDGFEQMGITGLPTFQTGFCLEKFKVPDFEKYDSTSCPKLHARLYVRRMSQYLQHEHIMIRTLQDSLTGSALTWYAQIDLNKINTWDKLARAFYNQYKFNMEVTPSMWDLISLRKGNNESFKEYAQRWRSMAPRIATPILEKDLISTFINTLEKPYFSHLLVILLLTFLRL